jgi:hypothetical protein
VKIDKQHARARERWPGKRVRDDVEPRRETCAGKATLVERAHASVPHEVGKRTLVEHTLYRHAEEAGDVDLEAPSVTQALDRAGSGQGLPSDVRGHLEGELGYALGRVRVHTDDVAAGAARSLRAEAFTVGEDIYFARGRFAPDTREGRKLIAHEVTHVVQAWEGRTPRGGGMRVSDPSSSLEREAVATSERLGGRAPVPAPRAAPGAPVRGGGLVMRTLDRAIPAVPSVQQEVHGLSPLAASRIRLLVNDVETVLGAMPDGVPHAPVENPHGLALHKTYVAAPDVRAGTRTMDGSTLQIARSRLDLPTSYRWGEKYSSAEEKTLKAELASLGAALATARALVKQAKAAVRPTRQATPAADPAPALAALEAKVTELEAKVAAKRAELTAAGATHDANQELQLTGDKGADEFWCSGLVMWTLAASGYNLGAPLRRKPDGAPYSYRRGAKGAPHTVTLKALIDGEPDAVEAMIRFERDPEAGAPSGIVELAEGEDALAHGGHRDGYGPDGSADAVKGVAGALALFGIGKAVPPNELKPGDFVQRRDPTPAYEADVATATARIEATVKAMHNPRLSVDDKAALEATKQALEARRSADMATKASADDLAKQIKTAKGAVKRAKATAAARRTRGARGAAPMTEEVTSSEAALGELQAQLANLQHMEHVGAGHIWQVNAVVARGDALFGAPGSPALLDGTAPTEPTWISDASFVIGPDTAPTLVGKHVVERQQRLEANYGTTNKAGEVTRADGVSLSKPLATKNDGDSVTPAAGSELFCGRIETSPWYAWTEATEATARASLAVAASAPPP